MSKVVKTIYANYLQLCRYRNGRFLLKPYTTVNERLGIYVNRQVPIGVLPELKWFMIGNGGYELLAPYGPRDVKHVPTHASLFNPIPFAIHRVDVPADTYIKDNFKLRVKETIDGIEYYCYYAKQILQDSNLDIYRLHMEFDIETITNMVSYIPDQLNLYPDPTVVYPDILTPHYEYVTAADYVVFEISTTDLQYIKDAFTIKYQSAPLYITEIAICSGIEFNPAPDWMDLYAVQVNYFIDTYYVVDDYINSDRRIRDYIHLGITEPLVNY